MKNAGDHWFYPIITGATPGVPGSLILCSGETWSLFVCTADSPRFQVHVPDSLRYHCGAVSYTPSK